MMKYFDAETGMPADAACIFEAAEYAARAEALQVAYLAIGNTHKAAVWEEERRVWRGRVDDRVDAHPMKRTVGDEAVRVIGSTLAINYINIT